MKDKIDFVMVAYDGDKIERFMSRDAVLELQEALAAAQSQEVCTVAHDDVDTCGYCQRDALAARMASLCSYVSDQLLGAHLADCGSLRGDDFNPHPKCDCEIDAVFAALAATSSPDSTPPPRG